MKKILFILLFIPTLLSAQTEVSVMGVPISLPAKQFVREWAAENNYELAENQIEWLNNEFRSTEEAEIYSFGAIVEFAGISGCHFEVYSNLDESINRIKVTNDVWNERRNMLPLKDAFDSRYGAPTSSQVNWEDVTYVYMVGSTRIEFKLFFKDNRHPELPSRLSITYTPNTI